MPIETLEKNANPLAIRCPPKAFTLEHVGKRRARFCAMIPADHSVEAVLNPNYFGHVLSTSNVKQGDIIEIEWEDFTRYGELQVRAIETSVHQVVTAVRSLNEYDMPQLPVGWSMDFINASSGWVLKFEDQVVQAGFKTTEEAAMRCEFLARQKLLATSKPKKVQQARGVKVQTEEDDGTGIEDITNLKDSPAEQVTERKRPGPKPKAASTPDTPKAN